MTERDAEIRAFLATTSWAGAQRSPLAGDASARSYQRLHLPAGNSAVLMDALPDHNAPPDTFIRYATHLRQLDLSAPRIFACDESRGLMLLEDLGDALYSREIPDGADEEKLFGAAVDVLAHIHAHPAPGGTADLQKLMPDQAGLVYDFYAERADNKSAFQAVLETLLAQYSTGIPVLCLRDFHAGNLLWLPDRQGLARVGLLDFQDAVLAHRSYDLVSLIYDARRDVPASLAESMINRYITLTGQDAAQFHIAAALNCAQRQLRILGIFARLARVFGKPQYLQFMPRTWAHLMRSLAHPALAPLRARVLADLTPPDDTLLQRMSRPCPTP
jgi:N-acetylmuramate 1-kinase